MATYFVDYENVGSAGIEGIDTLPEGNTVHIFYSVKADTMKMDQVIQLMRVSANVEFHDVTMRGQKNALDFQLIAMLYFTKKEDDTCYIISKDQGYDAAIVFGRKIGAEQVYRRVSICSENIGDVKPQQQTRRSGRRGGDSRQNAYNNNQEQPVLLAERAQGVTTLPYQREVIRPPRHGRKEEPVRQEAVKAAEPVRQEAVKAAEPVKKEEIKAAEPVKKEEVKAAEPVKKEEIKAAEPAKKEEVKTAEPVKKEEVKAAEPAKQEAVKAAEPVKKEEPKKAEPANREMPKGGIPSFRREVVVVKTVENAGRKEEPAKAAEPVKKEEPVKAAEPVKKEEPKAVAPVQMQEAEEPGFLKAAAQWDIFQSSFGGLFDIDIPAEYVDGDDEDEEAEAAPVKEEPAEQKDEPAKDPVKGEKHSRQRSRSARRRSQRAAQKAESAQAEAKEEAADQEEAKAKAEPAAKEEVKAKAEPAAKEEAKAKAEPAAKEEAKAKAEPAAKEEAKAKAEPAPKNEKKAKAEAVKKTDKKAKGESAKKAPAETAAPKDFKEVEKKVKEVMDGAGFALEAEDHALIAQALVSSSTKNQFYQFFRKTKGEAAGREFYLKIRGQYESLKVLREA